MLSEMLDKILDQTNCDIQPGVSWCVITKNPLTNTHGFSTYQLAVATKPKLPSTHYAELQTLTNIPTNKIVAKNSKAIHKAREAFITSEKSHNIRNWRYKILGSRHCVL